MEMNTPQKQFFLSKVFTAHKTDVKDVVCTNPTSVLTGSRDGNIKLWTERAGVFNVSLEIKQRTNLHVNSLAFYKAVDGGWLIFAGLRDGTIEVFNSGNSMPVTTLRNHSQNVCTLFVDKERRLLLSGSWDARAVVWSIDNIISGAIEVGQEIVHHKNSVWAAITLPGETLFYVTASADRTIKIHGPTFEELITLTGHTDVVRSLVAISPTEFISSANDGTIRWWSVTSTKCVRQYETVAGEFIYKIEKIKHRNGSEYIVAGMEHGFIEIFQLTDSGLSPVQNLRLPVSSVWSIAGYRRTDIAFGVSGGNVYVFTTDENRKADPSVLEGLDAELSALMVTEQVAQQSKVVYHACRNTEFSDFARDVRRAVGRVPATSTLKTLYFATLAAFDSWSYSGSCDEVEAGWPRTKEGRVLVLLNDLFGQLDKAARRRLQQKAGRLMKTVKVLRDNARMNEDRRVAVVDEFRRLIHDDADYRQLGRAAMTAADDSVNYDASGTSQLRNSRVSSASTMTDRLSRLVLDDAVDGEPHPTCSATGGLSALTDLAELLQLCGQTTPATWAELSKKFPRCSKIGEGTYGEVFKTAIGGVDVAMKVVPFVDKPTPALLINGESVQQAADVFPEAFIAKELSALGWPQPSVRPRYLAPTFVRLVRMAVVKGKFPTTLLSAWDEFKTGQNERPSTYSAADRLHIVFAMALGGTDLEKTAIRNEDEACSIFFQMALSLMVAEEALEFEHRDLHWGNVLISSCGADEEVRYVIDDVDYALQMHGVRVVIIDFTNSRIRHGGRTAFIDLSTDEQMFAGKGDHQFEVYRLMRKHNKNNWATFKPYTNVLWLDYLAKKIFTKAKISAKRRKELLELLGGLVKADRIADFLKGVPIAALLDVYVRR